MVIIYYFLLFYCYFLFSWSFVMMIKKTKKHSNKFKQPFNIYYFLNITDELIKK